MSQRLLAFPVTAVLAAAFVASSFTGSAAQPASTPSATSDARVVSVARPYAIEFRARSAHNYGHTFSIHGRVGANGRFIKPVVSGLHPATESPIPWMIGHIIAVPSETGASDGDTEDQYVTARFRVALTESEYKRVLGYIKELAAKSPVWHAVTYNCNAYIGDIARFMGYETPNSTLAMPEDFITGLRDANIGKTAGVIGLPVRVASAQALREAALKQAAARKPAKPPAAGTVVAGERAKQ